MFPPGEPQVPGKLSTPDQRTAGCRGCGSLRLEYNPNKEGEQTEFHCDQPLSWPGSNTAAWPHSRLSQPVRIAPSNRCHLFCDKVRLPIYMVNISILLCLQMLVSLVECKQGGIWTGNPELGLWCNSEPPNSSLTSMDNYTLYHNTSLQIYLILTFITRLEFFQSKGLMVDG